MIDIIMRLLGDVHWACIKYCNPSWSEKGTVNNDAKDNNRLLMK